MSVQRKKMKMEMDKKEKNKQENSLAWLIRIISYELKNTIDLTLYSWVLKYQPTNQLTPFPTDKTKLSTELKAKSKINSVVWSWIQI